MIILEEDEYVKKSKLLRSAHGSALCDLDPILKTPNEEENLLLKKFEERTREEKEKGNIMPRREVVKLLRERNQPIRIFGESDWDTFQRLKRVQLLEPETKGFRNDLIEALDKVDDADDEDVFAVNRKLQVVSGSSSEGGSLEVVIKDDMLTESDLTGMKFALSKYVAKHESTATDDATKAAVQISAGLVDTKAPIIYTEANYDDDIKGREKACEFTLRYFKYLLTIWGNKLNSRPRDEKLSYSGKMASATYAQTVEYIKPLFRSLKRKVIWTFPLNAI
ncbi:unnamed protein product [Protopolystoma xenopodis]|uniref:Pre-mRNA-splicing factor 18 n=1 Tax=Protopolystoma xenopodis TaxID=117903 RepID=A0A3S5A512_9PLAT|nr:unnamed protein product [Protopolystoma xenopodis]